MTAPSRLLLPPAPPHDPCELLLAGWIGPDAASGWRLARQDRAELAPGAQGGLHLSPAPASARRMTEPGGGFGGLRPPAHVAVSALGDVFLLDTSRGRLRRFDPCDCVFHDLPCIAGLMPSRPPDAEALGPSRLTPPRDRLSDPRAIAICGSRLVIADRGHGRLVSFALGSFVPLGPRRLPPGEQAGSGTPWAPTGLAFDGAGRLYVSDPVNGRIDVFGPDSRWERRMDVEPGTAALAVDCRDRLHAVVERVLTSHVAASALTVTVELNGGSAGFDWHGLRIAAAAPLPSLAVDLHTGDAPWSAAHRDDPANTAWHKWLTPADDPSTPRRLEVPPGRFLRLRLRPNPGHVPADLEVTAEGARLIRIDGDRVETLADSRADRARGFPDPPLISEAGGALVLPCAEGIGRFDAAGAPLSATDTAEALFERQGTVRTLAIDSRIEACTWHRVELRGAIPTGCSVAVAAHTAEIALTENELDSLPSEAWRALPLATTTEPARGALDRGPGRWDALLQAEPGRYVWLRLTLRGDGRQSPWITSTLVEYPRISLRRYLPGIFGLDPAGAEFTDRLTGVFDATLRSIESQLDRMALCLDPASAPAEAAPGEPDFLSWLGTWIGVTLDRNWPEERRRRFIKSVARLYARRGTAEGLRHQLLLLLGFDRAYDRRCRDIRPRRRCQLRPVNCGPLPDCTCAEPPPLVLEHFKLRRWLHLGHGRLGDESQVWGRAIIGRSELGGQGAPLPGQAQTGVTRLDSVPDPLHDQFRVTAHRFSVFVPSRIRARPAERRALESLVALESPAHTAADIRYVEPRFRVGIQAMIGFDSVIARTPQGVTLDGTRLRQGSVLTGRPYAPRLRVGDARVGQTTRLD